MQRIRSALLALAFFCALVLGVPCQTVAQSAPPPGDIVASGSLNNINTTVAVSVNGESTCSLSVQGTYAGTVTFEGTVDGSVYAAIPMTPFAGGTASSTTTTVGLWYVPCAGLSSYRARMSAYTSGAATIVLHSSMGVAFQAGGGGSGIAAITSPNGSLTPGGSPSGSTLDVNTAATLSWSAIQNFSGAAGSCASAPSIIYGACFGSGNGATNINAIGIGKITGGWGGTTVSNSGTLALYRNGGAGDSECDFLATSGGALSIAGSGCTSVTLNSKPFSNGSGTLTTGKMLQNATGDFAGNCTMAAGTSCTVTLVAAYTTPNCTATENVSASPVAAGVTITTTTVTVTAASSNSAKWFVHCFGDPT